MTAGRSEGATIFMFKGRALRLLDIGEKGDRLRLKGFSDAEL